MTEYEKETLVHILDLLACAFDNVYKLTTPEGIALTCMIDTALRYATQVHLGRDPRTTEEFYYEQKCLDEQGVNRNVFRNDNVVR